ncbi:hypothetical protein [Pleionea sediminis]|uniref:hypothetical protein n=1 Tax=Pleionea sediminis TaxID=2569479 RepID=UPI001185A577|nr:hypothetical protein [Pleionea sediminis]
MSASEVNKQLAEAPLPLLIKNLGQAVADAQFALDTYALEMLAKAAEKGVTLPSEDKPRSMLELGFTPTFYHFSEAKMLAKVAFSMSKSREVSVGVSASGGVPGIFTASVNASYSNKYSFKAEGSSEIATKVVSVPAPGYLADLIEDLRQSKREEQGDSEADT